jgi:hypothetical protein
VRTRTRIAVERYSSILNIYLLALVRGGYLLQFFQHFTRQGAFGVIEANEGVPDYPFLVDEVCRRHRQLPGVVAVMSRYIQSKCRVRFLPRFGHRIDKVILFADRVTKIAQDIERCVELFSGFFCLFGGLGGNE